MKSTRPIVLWICAAVLGIAAGLNYVRLFRWRSANVERQASTYGFVNSEDYTEVAAMLDDLRITKLSDSQLALLAKYASATGHGPEYVVGVLDNFYNDAIALKTLPIARTLCKTIPNHPIVLSLADDWAQHGCLRASRELRSDIPKKQSEGEP